MGTHYRVLRLRVFNARKRKTNPKIIICAITAAAAAPGYWKST